MRMKLAGTFVAILGISLAGCGTDHKKEARNELQRAASALKQGSPQVAITHLNRSLAKQASAEGYQLRAEARLDPKVFRQALADAEAALKLRPKSQELREVRDRAAACLKLLEGEARVVEVRYKRPSKIVKDKVQVVSQFDFGDADRQKQEFRTLVERNPIWRRRSAAQREAYIQQFLEMDKALMPLALSYERVRSATDESLAQANRNFDFELIAAFGLNRQVFCRGLRLGDLPENGRLLLSAEQRSAFLQDVEDSGTDVRKAIRLARGSATHFAGACYRFGVSSEHNIARHQHANHRWTYLDQDDERSRTWADMSFAKLRSFHIDSFRPVPLDLSIPVDHSPKEPPIRILPSSRSWPALADSTRVDSSTGSSERADVPSILNATSQ